MTSTGSWCVTLYGALKQAFKRVGVEWGGCYHEDRGDGALVLAPPEEPKAIFVESLPDELVIALDEHNGTHCEQEQIRLRMALHAGEVTTTSTELRQRRST